MVYRDTYCEKNIITQKSWREVNFHVSCPEKPHRDIYIYVNKHNQVDKRKNGINDALFYMPKYRVFHYISEGQTIVYRLQANCLVVKIEVLEEHIFTFLCVVYGCFHATTAELSRYDRDCIAHKLKTFIIWPFKKKFAILCFLKSSSLMNIYTKGH